jgi:hypothetical protein
MGCRNLGEKTIVFPKDPGADDDHSTTAPDQSGLSPNFPLLLVAQKRCVQIDRQRESLPLLPDLRLSNGQNRCGYIGQPNHGSRLDGPKRVADAVRDGHPADNPFFAPLLDEEFNSPGAPK